MQKQGLQGLANRAAVSRAAIACQRRAENSMAAQPMLQAAAQAVLAHLCCEVHDGVDLLCLQDKAQQVHGLDVSLDQLQDN
jgi:uncharacterized membrane-anchored protein